MAGGSQRRSGAGAPPRSLDGDRLAAVGLADAVERLPGVGPKRVRDFKKLGIDTIADLLTLWPRRHLDRTTITPIWQLAAGATVTVRGTIRQAEEHFAGPQKSYLKLLVEDHSGSLDVTFFHVNWLKRQLVPGRNILLSGKVDAFRHRLSMTHPEFELLDPQQTPRLGLIPIYPLAGELKQRFLQDLQEKVVPRWTPALPDPLPADLKAREKLPERGWAILHQHFPVSAEELEASRHRLVFDEFLRMSLAVLWLHKPSDQVSAPILNPKNELVTQFIRQLPFVLTAGQQRAWREIQEDLKAAKPMARLLQGDVGSGKTMLAALTMACAVGEGYQAALMAPTELLAEQHFLLFQSLFARLGVPVVLISGRERGNVEAHDAIRDGQPLIAIGTQALVSEGVSFGHLGAVVVDEQHRFGVRQRAQLGDKGLFPHMLVMTATPIPRTLALTVYGDLEVSQIEGLPPGRKPVETFHLPIKERRKAYLKVMESVRQGRQAYVVCPLVEESEDSQGRAATLLAAGMRKISGWRVGLIHGRMGPQEKSEVMEKFRRGEIDVLVGTTILEVGVDVANATVIVIEEADHFGLAQLHQLRGRVGRGEEMSSCYLLADPLTADGEARIHAMVHTHDGFKLAEADLAMRGPGEVLGMRQHGVAGFQLANPLKDLKLLEKARAAAQEILTQDPNLTLSDHQELKKWVFEALTEALPGHVLH